jgi:multidrug efflux pump subunit AcrA (membrane-fusion protein)
VDKAPRPVLPQTAVMADDNGSYVLIVNAAGRVERRAVRVSGTTNGGVIVAGGLTGNERVVATAGGFLRDGEEVKVAPAAGGNT